MKRTLFALAAVVVLALAGAAFLRVPQAQACSRVPLLAEFVPDAVRESRVVAIGTVVDHSERWATFRVDEPLAGAPRGQALKVDNRTTYTGMACSPYDEEFHEGYRFKTGETLVMMLEKEVGGLWQVAAGSWAAWPLPADELEPMVWDGGTLPEPMISVDAVSAQVQAAAAALNADPGFEWRPPCNGTVEIGARIATSTVVVLAEVAPGSERQTARVIRVLAGEAAGTEISVNFRTRRDYEKCELDLAGPLDPAHSPAGRYILYLRPDETGVAEYRPAVWGSAMQLVNDRFVTHGYPTMGDIREAVASAPQRPAVTTSDGSSNNAWRWGLVVALAVALFGAAGWWVRQRAGRAGAER